MFRKAREGSRERSSKLDAAKVGGCISGRVGSVVGGWVGATLVESTDHLFCCSSLRRQRERQRPKTRRASLSSTHRLPCCLFRFQLPPLSFSPPPSPPTSTPHLTTTTPISAVPSLAPALASHSSAAQRLAPAPARCCDVCCQSLRVSPARRRSRPTHGSTLHRRRLISMFA